MDYRQSGNEKKYDIAAQIYDVIAFTMSLGQARKVYQAVADCIQGESTQNIVEFGCGPASVIPFLVEQAEPDTQIIGVDFSAKMIEKKR